MARSPGTSFDYNSGNSHLLSAIVARLTGGQPLGYARAELFGPLGITDFIWPQDPQGIPGGGAGLYLLPRDMAKIGRLVLQGGQWDKRQVIPAAWVAAAIQPHAQVEPDPKCGMRYGYFWWLSPGCDLTPAQPYASAIGNGGQRIALVPEHDMVIVITCGLYNKPGQRQTTNAIIHDILADLPNSVPAP